MATNHRATEDGPGVTGTPMNLATIDMSGAATYRKPGTIKAVQLDPEGGDWVAEDAKGQRWLITNEVFQQNYARA